jgi:endonuclease/exonuclease/phosphatase (EEP) superfamily protein YafD
MLKDYPTILIGDFNINMLKKTTQSTTFQILMSKYKLKFFFSKSTTINNTQIDHIWTNAQTQQCHSGITQTYWTNHKPVYFTFKLLNYVPQFFYHKYITYKIYTIYHVCQTKSINCHLN